MTLFFQQLISGLAIGFVYAGLALALSVVYEGAGVLNFAQGEMATVSAFLAWVLTTRGMTFWLAFPIVLVISFVLGLAVERIFIRPLERASEQELLMVTLALYLGINAIVGWSAGYLQKTLTSPFGSDVWIVHGTFITSQQVGAAAVLVGVLLLVGILFQRTSIGLRIRAAAQNPESSRLLGISVGWMLALGWGIAAVVGAAAGTMAAPTIGLQPDMMGPVLLLAFAAAALGGFGSRVGAVVGGLVIGVASSLAAQYVDLLAGDLNQIVPFAVILVVLLFRPQGLFGRASALRV